MTDAHALLQAAWQSGDLLPLLVLADWLDEHGDADTAALIRLTATEAGTARHSPLRVQELERLRATAQARAAAAGWPDLVRHPDTVAACVSRRADARTRELILLRPADRTVHWLRSAVEGRDAVVQARSGEELLRRRMPPPGFRFFPELDDPLRPYAGFALGHDFFPLPENGHTNRDLQRAEQQRQLDAALRPAEVGAGGLPAKLVPVAAWVTADYLTGRTRRVQAGERVPGAHLFSFPVGPGPWRHAAAVENRDAGRAAALARQRMLRDGRMVWHPSASATLLVRVADDRRVAARKLVWGARAERESGPLSGPGATLPRAAFDRAAGELSLAGLVRERFVVDAPDKLQALFARDG